MPAGPLETFGERQAGRACSWSEARFGRGGYTFRNIPAASMLSTDGFVLVHGCIERVAEPSNWSHRDGGKYDQLVTVDPEEVEQEYDCESMHTIVILPGGRGRNRRFYCHNLAADWGDRGASVKHLGLNREGQPECPGYYMRFISRAYHIDVHPERAETTADDAAMDVDDAEQADGDGGSSR
jgi:hypothetical protein